MARTAARRVGLTGLLLLLACTTVAPPPPLARADDNPHPGAAAVATASDDSRRDVAFPGGWLYAQENRLSGQDSSDGGSLRGYTVTDDADAAFWTAFRRFGGVDVLGYPLSRRFRYPAPDGYLHQAFQRGILQWRPEQGRAVLANTLDMFTDQGLDDRLETVGIPRPAPAGGLPLADDAARRMSWVVEPNFVARYLTDPISGKPFASLDDAWDRLGLPSGQAVRVQAPQPPGASTSGSEQAAFVAQRFQKGVLEAFSQDGPDDATVVPGDGKKGCVALAAVGRLARGLGSGKIIPSAALALEPPDQLGPPRVAAFIATLPPGAMTGDVELLGEGFAPGKPVTIRLVPADTSLAATTVPIATAASDGSFSQSIQAPVGGYAVSVRSAAGTASPSADLAIDLAEPTRFATDASTRQPC